MSEADLVALRVKEQRSMEKSKDIWKQKKKSKWYPSRPYENIHFSTIAPDDDWAMHRDIDNYLLLKKE